MIGFVQTVTQSIFNEFVIGNFSAILQFFIYCTVWFDDRSIEIWVVGVVHKIVSRFQRIFGSYMSHVLFE